MTRITNELFESIRQITHPTSVEEKKLDTADVDTPVKEGRVDAAHFCATHVEHAMLGLGTCIAIIIINTISRYYLFIFMCL